MKLRKLAAFISETKYQDKVQELLQNLNREGLCARQVFSVQELPKEQGVLYLTDNPEAFRAVCSVNGCAVVFLHEENRDLDFSGAQYAVEDIADLEARCFERIYLRLTGQPWEILETKRCIVRETVEEDVNAFYRIYSDPTVTEYTEPLYEDKEKEKQYIRNYRKYCYGFYEFGIWSILEKAGGQVIGRAGINMREGFDIPEIGFVVGSKWQRKGYAYEVCSAITDYARTQLHMEALQALVLPENKASVRLCGKLGFVRQGEAVWAGKVYQYYFLRLR